MTAPQYAVAALVAVTIAPAAIWALVSIERAIVAAYARRVARLWKADEDRLQRDEARDAIVRIADHVDTLLGGLYYGEVAQAIRNVGNVPPAVLRDDLVEIRLRELHDLLADRLAS